MAHSSDVRGRRYQGRQVVRLYDRQVGRSNFLVALGKAPTNGTRQGLILEILKSFDKQNEWEKAKRELKAGDLERIRPAVAWNRATENKPWCQQIEVIQNRIHEDLRVLSVC